MPIFAIIEEGTVTNIIVAETKEIAESVTGKICIESKDGNIAHIGLSYDGTLFEQPKIEPEDIEQGDPNEPPIIGK
jgi:hypothetical protein